MIFSFQFRKIITRYRRVGYDLNVMRQSACLVFYPITIDNCAAFFNCTPVGRASDYDGPDIKLFVLLGWGRSFLSVAWWFNWWFSSAPELVSYWAPRDRYRRAAYSFCESSFLIHHGIYHDVFICP